MGLRYTLGRERTYEFLWLYVSTLKHHIHIDDIISTNVYTNWYWITGFFHFSGCGENIVYDLGFAIDGSNSIDNNEYRLTKDFVKDVIGIFTISEQETHVGLLEYASEASIKIYFDDYFETGELLEFVETLTQAKGGSTNIAEAWRKRWICFPVTMAWETR